MNHVIHIIHIIAVTQIRYPTNQGRPYFERRLGEGKTDNEALRSLKRRISDALYARLLDDARDSGGWAATPWTI